MPRRGNPPGLLQKHGEKAAGAAHCWAHAIGNNRCRPDTAISVASPVPWSKSQAQANHGMKYKPATIFNFFGLTYPSRAARLLPHSPRQQEDTPVLMTSLLSGIEDTRWSLLVRFTLCGDHQASRNTSANSDSLLCQPIPGTVLCTPFVTFMLHFALFLPFLVASKNINTKQNRVITKIPQETTKPLNTPQPSFTFLALPRNSLYPLCSLQAPLLHLLWNLDFGATV